MYERLGDLNSSRSFDIPLCQIKTSSSLSVKTLKLDKVIIRK